MCTRVGSPFLNGLEPYRTTEAGAVDKITNVVTVLLLCFPALSSSTVFEHFTEKLFGAWFWGFQSCVSTSLVALKRERGFVDTNLSVKVVEGTEQVLFFRLFVCAWVGRL